MLAGTPCHRVTEWTAGEGGALAQAVRALQQSGGAAGAPPATSLTAVLREAVEVLGRSAHAAAGPSRPATRAQGRAAAHAARAAPKHNRVRLVLVQPAATWFRDPATPLECVARRRGRSWQGPRR